MQSGGLEPSEVGVVAILDVEGDVYGDTGLISSQATFPDGYAVLP